MISKLPDVKTSIFSVMSALANQHDAINLSQGFPDYESDRGLSELVWHYMKEGHNQYAPMQGVPSLRNAIAKKVKKLYQTDIDAENEITITAGATEALYSSIAAFVRYGDEVIVIEPSYDSYIPAIKLNGGVPVSYRLRAPGFLVDWDELAALISEKTRMIIINTPNNPSTTVFRENDMMALEAILSLYPDIVLLSDEVYEHIIYNGVKHHSVLKYPRLMNQSIAVYSFGKLFHNTGWKVGYAIGPKHLMDEFRKVHQFNVFSVNTPVQLALADYLVQHKTYEDLPLFFEEKKQILIDELDQTKLKLLPSEGSYFLLADYSNISDSNDMDFSKFLVKEIGVATIPISPFYSMDMNQRLLRFCFAKKEETLKAAGERLRKL